MGLEYKALNSEDLLDVVEEMKEELGTDKLLDELIMALSSYDLQDNLEYIANNNDIDVFDKYDDTFDIDRLADWIADNAYTTNEKEVIDTIDDLIELVGSDNAIYYKDSTATGVSMYFDCFSSLSEAIKYLNSCDIYQTTSGYTIIPVTAIG
mgnify:FL=1